MPAVTMVAACINAETGVGPSIASKSQTCKPNCEDLPITPKNTNINKKSKTEKKEIYLKKTNDLKYKGRIQYIIEKSKDFVKKKIIEADRKKPISPILLNMIAFSAAFDAEIRVDQKLISKNEQIPTPSQPNNNTQRLEEVTSISIKNVNKEI